MKTRTLTPATDTDTTVERTSRLSHATLDYRPRANAQRALQQKLDARPSGAFTATTEALQGTGGGVVQRVRERSKSLPARLRTQSQQIHPQQAPLWQQLLEGQDGEFAEEPEEEELRLPEPRYDKEEEPLSNPENKQEEIIPQAPEAERRLIVPQELLGSGERGEPIPSLSNNEQGDTSPLLSQTTFHAQHTGYKAIEDGRENNEVPRAVPGKSLGRRTADYLMTGGPDQKPVLPIRTLIRDTPGPTGGLGMLGNIAASGVKAMNSAGYWNHLAKYVPHVQTFASAISATGDALAIGKTVYKYVTKPGDEEKQQKRRNKMWLRGADLASNVLSVGSGMVVDPTLGAYMSLAGSALGIGVQGVATHQAREASKKKDSSLVDKVGPFVTGADLLSNVYSIGSGIHSLVKGSSPALDTASSFIGAVPPVMAGITTGAKEISKRKSGKKAPDGRPTENTRLINGDIEEGYGA